MYAKKKKTLQLHDLRVGDYFTDKHALWPDFGMINENTLHGTGRRLENALEGITCKLRKKQKRLEHLMLIFTWS